MVIESDETFPNFSKDCLPSFWYVHFAINDLALEMGIWPFIVGLMIIENLLRPESSLVALDHTFCC